MGAYSSVFDQRRGHIVGKLDGKVALITGSGAGIGLLSESLIRRELLEGTLIPIPGLAPCEDVEFSVVWMKDTGGRILNEVMEAAVATSPFQQKMADSCFPDKAGA